MPQYIINHAHHALIKYLQAVARHKRMPHQLGYALWSNCLHPNAAIELQVNIAPSENQVIHSNIPIFQ
jgi:hypothetical protein